MVKWNGVKVFAASMHKDRDVLGEVVTAWMQSHPENKIVEALVTQSSDHAFHCVTITLFYRNDAKSKKEIG